MSEDEESIEERVQKAIVDRDKLKRLEEQNARLGRINEIYRKVLEDIPGQLDIVNKTVRDIQTRIQDLEDIE